MERPDTRLLTDQPYDESLELHDSEEVVTPTPTHTQLQSKSRQRSRKGRGQMAANSSSDEFEEEKAVSHRAKEPISGQPGLNANEEEEEEEDDDEEEEDSDEEESDDDEEAGAAPKGAYDPADYENLPVTTEIKELFQYITRYTPQPVELEHKLKPFIPDFIPAVGDIDAFLKVPRPDGKTDDLGLVVLDEPCVKQSDPTVLSLWLSEESKQHNATELKKVTSVASPHRNPRAVEGWVESISALHRSKPAASVLYGRPMPDIDSLMQEWPCELEELLGAARPPPAALACSLAQYAELLCALLDIPVYCSRIHSLHLLFSLYLEFCGSAHFKRRA
ncbi:intraflagellar transport protein 46 homolog [Myripristis murdjan]|uniref:Intraflagellar transport protein 46 homolog n=1 Tax=Myripristis murdjan TaxID=586833 RepID=A0A668A115_9TELE|nr:intraflagellar transport protein 46 homolog [Myripristis murdjan]